MVISFHDLIYPDIQNTPFNDVNNQCKETVKDKDPLEDFNQRLRELDVEAVLAKQETHDLFCPNCKSTVDSQPGPDLFLSQLQVHPRLATRPKHFCPSCKSTLDSQLGPNLFFVSLTSPSKFYICLIFFSNA